MNTNGTQSRWCSNESLNVFCDDIILVFKLIYGSAEGFNSSN